MTVSRLVLALALALPLTACVSPDGDKRAEQKEVVPPPKITADMPLDKALEAGIDFGGDTLQDVKHLIKKRGEQQKAAQLLEPSIRDGYEKWEHHQLLNAGHLYAATPAPLDPKLFHQLVSADRPIARQLGWQLAAAKPSAIIARAVEAELTRAVADNELDGVLLPQMATAVQTNRLKSSYTVVRNGLLAKGNEEFAAAMIALDPARASDDFLQYLALAPAEELRQLTLSSVNLYTCIAILRHMQRVPPSLGAAQFDHLFVFAVSRNTGLAELAQNVIETYVPQRTEVVAQSLARHPAWVQIAYLENARQKMNPKLGLLLGELKKATAENDVVEEIEEIKF